MQIFKFNLVLDQNAQLIPYLVILNRYLNFLCCISNILFKSKFDFCLLHFKTHEYISSLWQFYFHNILNHKIHSCFFPMPQFYTRKMMEKIQTKTVEGEFGYNLCTMHHMYFRGVLISNRSTTFILLVLSFRSNTNRERLHFSINTYTRHSESENIMSSG